ncbi:MAG: hypothetical protein ABFC96_18690, partial [Thermoguttaceae bacterium]
LAKSQWRKATDNLREVLAQRPHHSLANFLLAWCYANDPSLGDSSQVVTLLKDVARQGAGPLARQITAESFPSLSVATRLEILSSRPRDAMGAADWDVLARLATAADRPKEALAHARMALSLDDGSLRFERRYTVINLMLRSEQAKEAVESARRWVAEATTEQRAELAELVARFGQLPTADELFIEALAAKGVTALERYRLLCRQAALHQGQKRWPLLIEAAELATPGSPRWRQCVDLIVADLVDPSQAETAGQLASRARQPALKARLLLTQAALAVDPATSATVYRQLETTSRLPKEDYLAAFVAWNASSRPEQVIETAERWLRSGRRLEPAELRELSLAYRAVGRENDARRAVTEDRQPPLIGSPARRPRGSGMGMW